MGKKNGIIRQTLLSSIQDFYKADVVTVGVVNKW